MISDIERQNQGQITKKISTGKQPTHEAETSEELEILFVDDDVDVIRINKIILEHMGYTVTTSSKANEALEMFKTYPTKFDLVITDITMPEKSGFDLTKELLEIRNDISVIICSGYTSSETENRIKAAGAKAFITKPATMQTIASTVKRVLAYPLSDSGVYL